MLAIEPIRAERVYWWAIEQITQRKSSDVRMKYGPQDTWEGTLHYKRMDDHYPAVVESIQTNGFINPLNADIEYGELRLSDGHHRFAAALDLGHEAVPVFVNDRPTVAPDSGYWEAGHPVATQAGVSYRDRPGSSAYSGIIGSW